MTHDERKWMQNINAIMMDCTSICRMLQRSTVIRSGDSNDDGDGNGIVCSTPITMQKRVKNIRLTHGQLKQQSRCKTRLVLLLLGLWMNLIAVTNGKWKIQLVKHMFCSPFFLFNSLSTRPKLFPFHSN